MNKRKQKKKNNNDSVSSRKGKDKYWNIEADGNNGGDIIKIHDNEDGTLHIWSGSCCVVGMDMVVPVEFLTGLIQKSIIDNHKGIEGVIEQFDWNKEFKDTLIKKVRLP